MFEASYKNVLHKTTIIIIITVIITDKLFTSLPLLTELESTDTVLWRTYQTNRVGFPKDSTNKQSLTRGQHSNSIARYNGNTTCVVWMDVEGMSDRHWLKAWIINGLIYLLTNVLFTLCAVHLRFHECKVKEFRFLYITSTLPSHCWQLLPLMGGVDPIDQLKGSYSYNHTSKSWWVRLFFSFNCFTQ